MRLAVGAITYLSVSVVVSLGLGALLSSAGATDDGSVCLVGAAEPPETAVPEAHTEAACIAAAPEGGVYSWTPATTTTTTIAPTTTTTTTTPPATVVTVEGLDQPSLGAVLCVLGVTCGVVSGTHLFGKGRGA